jgi:hypothetical protein
MPRSYPLLRETGLRWYGADADCPAWGEPSGDDFQSSALIEAECMRRLLPPDRFLPWFDRFLPRIAQQEPATLCSAGLRFSDRTDGKIAHLDGLNLSRAWCWNSLAGALPPDDARRPVAQEAAAPSRARLPHIAGDYMGEHWLATFAVLALEAGQPE